MTDAGPALEKVLNLLLPRLLSRIGKNDEAKKSNRNNKRKAPSSPLASASDLGALHDQINAMHESIHKKLIEMLTHTMKRVREERNCQLPCGAILELLLPVENRQQQQLQTGEKMQKPSTGLVVIANPFTINLSLAFLTLGVNRTSPSACSDLLPGLLTFLACLLLEGRAVKDGSFDNDNCVGISHILDASRKMRFDQTCHLILRCLEYISCNPLEKAAMRRAADSSSSNLTEASSNNVNETSAESAVPSLKETKRVIITNPVVGAALFEIFSDVFLYTPVSAASSLIPCGMSTSGYERLINGAASGKMVGGNSKNWKEEFASRTRLRELKLKMLELIAPCRRFALFLFDDENGGDGASKIATSEKVGNDCLSQNNPADNGALSSLKERAMGISRTVALMVLLTGDSDPDVKSKAESYLRAHMDSYRGKDAEKSVVDESSLHDALLGNSAALAQSLLNLVIGGVASISVTNRLMSQYKLERSVDTLKLGLGVSYHVDNTMETHQKALLSCCRKKVDEFTSAKALKFVAKMLEENPKLFHVCDLQSDESDVVAVSIGSLTLSAFGDLRKPGSSGSAAVESVASLLNALCLRLTMFYDARMKQSSVETSRARIRQILAKSMVQASAVLAPMSSGQGGSSTTGSSTKTANTQLNIRDQCYGVVCTLARSSFCLDECGALYDCGNIRSFPEKTNQTNFNRTLKSISTASMLFGCVANEVEMLRPRATSALDALLSAYVRVVTSTSENTRRIDDEKFNTKTESVTTTSTNPWADIRINDAVVDKKNDNTKEIDGLSRSLIPLLWTSSRRSQPKSSRLAAVRWSNELLIHLDAKNAIHLLCFLSGDDDATVSMIAKKALGVESSLGDDFTFNETEWSNSSEVILSSVTFTELIETIVGRAAAVIPGRPKFAEFVVPAKAATCRFILQSLFSEGTFYGQESCASAVDDYVMTILGTFAAYQGRSLSREESDLLDECSICLESCVWTFRETRVALTSSEICYGFNDIAAQAVSSSSSKTRRHLSRIMGCLYEDHCLWNDAIDSSERLSISQWLEKSGLIKNAQMCREILEKAFESSFVTCEIHGAAFLGSSCLRAFRLGDANGTAKDSHDVSPTITKCWNECSRIVHLLGKGLMHADEVIGNACAQGLVISFSYDGHDAPILNTFLYEGFALALNELNSALKKFNSIDHADPTRASTLIRAAGVLLAASTSGAGSRSNTEDVSVDLGPARLQCTEALFSILGGAAYRKDEELSLAVGEALAAYADAFGNAKWSNESEIWPDDYDEVFAFELPPHQHVLYTLFHREVTHTNPLKRNASAAVLLALVAHATRQANLGRMDRAMVKQVSKRINLFQDSFIKLLSDPKSKQLSRESCCRGLAACRGLAHTVGDDGGILNERLLKAFGQTAYGGSAMIETESQARERRNERDGADADFPETEIGGAAGITESALGAFREMAAAAISLGRPDTVYSLLILSTSHSAWLAQGNRDKYNEKSLLGNTGAENSVSVRNALRPHLGKLVPRLLRACNDPNKHTREQMNSLWVALTGGGAESRAVITQNFLSTIDTLIQDAVCSSWRARAGACSAISDIIVGRSWDELGGGGVVVDDDGEKTNTTASIRLIRLWRSALRALDDVRLVVRERGEVLGRSLRALTIRLCDPSVLISSDDTFLSDSDRMRKNREIEVQAEYAAAVSLGWLVKYGLNAPCPEATGICISCLLGIVDVSKPTTLQPVLAELCYALLMAMSGLEPAALNYLQVRAAGDSNSGGSGNDRYDNLERIRIQAAMSGPIATALNKCLEMVKHVDLETQQKLVPVFDSSLRTGAGFATRAATADAVTNLSNSCPSAFRFKGISSVNPTVRLLRALYYASERERGVTAKDKMTHALGNLAALAPGSSVRQLVIKACKRYCESSGSNNDPSARKAAAATVRAIVVRSSNQLYDGGPNDIWRKKVLPLAFLGRHDEDTKVSNLWKDVWDEGGSILSSSGSKDDTYGITLQENLLPFLEMAIISALRDMSWARRRQACSALLELSNSNILAPTPRSMIGDDDENDHDRFRQRAKSSSVLLRECTHIIARPRVWAGKADIIKAGSIIAGKWCSIAPAKGTSIDLLQSYHPFEWFPIILKMDSFDDLFNGDGWFALNRSEADYLQDADCDVDEGKQPVANDDEYNGDESGLNLTDENEFEEEPYSGATLVKQSSMNTGEQSVSFSGFCRLILDQGLKSPSQDTEGILPYRAAALSNLSNLLQSLVSAKGRCVSDYMIVYKRNLYHQLAPRLFSSISDGQSKDDKSMPPLLVANALECLASLIYDSIGDPSFSKEQNFNYSDPMDCLNFFVSLSGNSAWTIRQMSTLAASSLVAKMATKCLQKNEAITVCLDCATKALKDRKFWKVRQAGLDLVLSLVSRVGKQRVSEADSENRLIMESILPYKEKILHITRASLLDNEAQVTATASKISLAMTWWP